MKPIFFERNRVKRVYRGGLLFGDFLGDAKEDSNYPEEWIASTVAALNKDSTNPLEGLSIPENSGITLKELIESHPQEILGSRENLGVLVKYLDSAIRLPIQVHPDKAFSQKYFQSSFGKVEMWLILATRENASICFGFKERFTKEEFSEAVEASLNNKNALTPYLNQFPVKTGEVYLIPARAVHAIGYGCLILEVQEPTDFTIQPEYWCGDYLLNDYEMYLGLPKSDALDCFDFSVYGQNCIAFSKKEPKLLYDKEGVAKESLISYQDTPCFCVNRYRLQNACLTLDAAPAVYLVTDGCGCLTGCGYERPLKKGGYFLLPHCAKERYRIVTSSYIEIVECNPPIESGKVAIAADTKTDPPSSLNIIKKGFNYSQDGPGNRLVYHLQGCNMVCPWCANPEGLSVEGTTVTEKNTLLDALTTRCSFKTYSLDELETEALDSRCLFMDGGGVTFSGGEPTLQFQPLKKLLARLHAQGIHTTIETNGSNPRLPELFPFLDMVIIDLKHIDDAIHHKTVGLSNTATKENIRAASRLHTNVLIRTPLINGFNTAAEYPKQFCEFYKTCNTENLRFELLAYHEFGKEKWEACGLPYQIHNGFIAEDIRALYEKTYREAGLQVVRT